MEKKTASPTPKTRQSRTPKLKYGKEVSARLLENGTFLFAASLTTTVDASNYVPIGRINVPEGYALILNGSDYGMTHSLIIPEQFITGDTYVQLPCINFSAELRRIYAGDVIAKGILVKLTEKVSLEEIKA